MIWGGNKNLLDSRTSKESSVTMKFVATLSTLLAITLSLGLAQESTAQGFGAASVQAFTKNSSVDRFSTARIRGTINNQSYGTAGVRGVNARSFGNAFSAVSSGAKPFQGLNRGPAVTPYLGLSNSFNQVSDYYNIVRPQQEFERLRNQQQRTNDQTQRALVAQQHRLNQMAAAPPFDIRGDEDAAPTGHGTTYMSYSSFQNTGNYFSPVQGLEKRR